MRFRDFVREARFRTVGLNGMRWIGNGLIVPVPAATTGEWLADYSHDSCPNIEPELKSGDEPRTLIRG